MSYESQTYFQENEEPDVKGFTILRVDDGECHIAEKWLAGPENDNTEDKWMSYWIPESDLDERVENGDCEKVGNLTDEQFTTVCEKVGWEEYSNEQKEAIPA